MHAKMMRIYCICFATFWPIFILSWFGVLDSVHQYTCFGYFFLLGSMINLPLSVAMSVWGLLWMLARGKVLTETVLVLLMSFAYCVVVYVLFMR